MFRLVTCDETLSNDSEPLTQKDHAKINTFPLTHQTNSKHNHQMAKSSPLYLRYFLIFCGSKIILLKCLSLKLTFQILWSIWQFNCKCVNELYFFRSPQVTYCKNWILFGIYASRKWRVSFYIRISGTFAHMPQGNEEFINFVLSGNLMLLKYVLKRNEEFVYFYPETRFWHWILEYVLQKNEEFICILYETGYFFKMCPKEMKNSLTSSGNWILLSRLWSEFIKPLTTCTLVKASLFSLKYPHHYLKSKLCNYNLKRLVS